MATSTYTIFEMMALTDPIDAWGYNHNAAPAPAASERNDCGACPEHPGTLTFNAADQIWVCAACDLAINEAVRVQLEEELAFLEAREPRCNASVDAEAIAFMRTAEISDPRLRRRWLSHTALYAALKARTSVAAMRELQEVA